MNKRISSKGIVVRLLKTIYGFYPVLLPTALFCIILNAIVSSIPSIFMQNVIALIEESWKTGDWNGVKGRIFFFVGLLAFFYVISLIAGFTYNQLMAVITQGTLKKLREKMFNGMQRLPVKYFDTTNHGDIMSHYTNDIDTLRQMVSQSFPQLLISAISATTIFCIMIYFSVWLALFIVAGVCVMLMVTKKLG